ncbi:hypothetical protein JCM17961_36120 [Endothiovibrio diazotrophicus]
MLFQIVVVGLLLLIVLLLVVLLFQGRRLPDGGGRRVEPFRQLETYLSLRDRLDLRRGLAYDHAWSAAPDFLKLIVDHALAERPATIVECSSGVTTLMLARCCELNGTGAVWSLENGPEFAARTRGELARYGLEGVATVLDAPLRPWSLDGDDYRWYAVDHLPERPIEMLVIDGPPGFLQRQSRYPALPLLFERLADRCTVFLDDAARPDEQALVARWLARWPGEIEHRFIDNERGCAVLRLHRCGGG